MASSPLRSKSYHARSVSLPSRSHPLIPQFSKHLCRLRASEDTSSSLASICKRLSGLENLYDCVDDLLVLPQTLQRLAQEYNEKWVEEALDSSIRVLDACAVTKDIFSRTKEDVKEQLSTLRRKREASDFGWYLTSRRKVKKVIQKLMKNMKSTERKDTVLGLLAIDKDQETIAFFSMIKEVEAITLEILESSLSCAMGSKVQSRGSGWSLVSKLMHPKEAVISEFQKIDAAVNALTGLKQNESDDNKKNMENVQNQLGELELSIQGLEEFLERLFRRLIKTRVSLLNILNH